MSVKAEHERVVKYIAENRFPFPDQTDWPEGYRTLTNVPEKQFEIQHDQGMVTPDIVIVDSQNSVRESAEVADVIDATIAERWSTISSLTPIIPEKDVRHFFVYVPESIADEALQILKSRGISYAGLRSYRIEGDEVAITPVDTPGHDKDHR